MVAGGGKGTGKPFYTHPTQALSLVSVRKAGGSHRPYC